MIKLVLADDHTMVRQGIAALLERHDRFELAGQAADGRQVLELIEETRPEIAIVDVIMPRLGGLDVLEEVQRRRLPTKLVLLTMHADPKSAARALEAGAAGYVLKDNAFEDLVYALHAVAAGGTFISPAIAAATVKYAHEKGGGRDPLTAREREILKLIASGLTNRQIADRLDISIKTVETHRARIMDALGFHNTAELVRYAMEKGIA